MASTFLSHKPAQESREVTLARIVDRLMADGLDHLIPLAEEMSQGPIALGLMRQGGVDGSLHDQVLHGGLLSPLCRIKHHHPADVKVLNNCSVTGLVERFHSFQSVMRELIVNRQITSDSTIASIPCGLMRELLTLDYEGERPHIVGVDKDPLSLAASKELAKELAISHVEFYLKDALFLGPIRSVDVIVSNGLSVYLDDAELLDLFQQFQGSIRPGGYFLTTHMTPEAEWNPEHATEENLQFHRDFFRNIVRGRWLSHLRSIDQVCAMLDEAGFDIVEIRPGETGIFPIYLTRRR